MPPDISAITGRPVAFLHYSPPDELVMQGATPTCRVSTGSRFPIATVTKLSESELLLCMQTNDPR